MKDLYNMNDEIIERLEIVRETFGFTTDQFTEWVDIGQPFVNEYGLIPNRFTSLITAFPQLEISWILFGEGAMLEVQKAQCLNCEEKTYTEGKLEGVYEACHLLKLQLVSNHPDAWSKLRELNRES